MNLIQQNSNSSVVKCVWPATRQTQVPTPTSALLRFLLWLCYHTTNKTFEWLTSLPICFLIHSGGGGGVKYRSPPPPSHPWPRSLSPSLPVSSDNSEPNTFKHLASTVSPKLTLPMSCPSQASRHTTSMKASPKVAMVERFSLHSCSYSVSLPESMRPTPCTSEWQPQGIRNQMQGPAHRLDIHLLSWEWPGNGHIPWHTGSDIHCPETALGTAPSTQAQTFTVLRTALGTAPGTQAQTFTVLRAARKWAQPLAQRFRHWCPESGQEMGTMPGACQGSGCLDSDKKSGTGLSTQVQIFTVLRLWEWPENGHSAWHTCQETGCPKSDKESGPGPSTQAQTFTDTVPRVARKWAQLLAYIVKELVAPRVTRNQILCLPHYAWDWLSWKWQGASYRAWTIILKVIRNQIPCLGH